MRSPCIIKNEDAYPRGRLSRKRAVQMPCFFITAAPRISPHRGFRSPRKRVVCRWINAVIYCDYYLCTVLARRLPPWVSLTAEEACRTKMPWFLMFPSSFFSLYTSTFQLLDKPWSQVSSLLPPGSWLQFFIAHRVQQSHCSSIFHRVLLTHALALSASQFVHKKKSPRIYTSMHSGGFELTKLTYML